MVAWLKRSAGLVLLVAMVIGMMPTIALGQEASGVQEVIAEVAAEAEAPNAADTAWMLVSAALVCLMTPGLAFFYGGLVRRKNVLSILMQCFMCMGLVTVLWMVVGFSLAFGENTLGGFIGSPLTYFMLKGLSFTEVWSGLTISQQLFMIFQCMFAIITPALIIGAFAERMKFSAFTLFTTIWLLVIYCPVAHWVWGGAEGIFALGGDGALDFAGGTVIHINAGIAALVACLVLGKRLGFAEGKISPPHNLPIAVLGAALLWFGWFGFNGGSAGAASDQAVRALVVTHIATAAAALAWAVIEWIRNGKPTVLGIITGAVAGLVGITPGAGFVDPIGALLIGLGATIVAYFFVAVVKHKLGYDDSLDVFGVHGMAGIWGAIATGIFAVKGYGIEEAGGLLEGNVAQLVIQLKAVVYTLIYSGIGTFVILKLIDVTMGLRSSERSERIGLDLTDHSENAYTILE
jgi:Amt family ammonium transporter